MRQIRSGNGSAGRFINDPALYNNANEIALQLRKIADDLRAGRGTAGKLLTDDELYNRINRTADRLDRSVDQIDSMIADINAGRGTIGKLIKDEQSITMLGRLSLVSTPPRSESTTWSLPLNEAKAQSENCLTDDALYSNVNQLSSEGVKMIYDFRQNPRSI